MVELQKRVSIALLLKLCASLYIILACCLSYSLYQLQTYQFFDMLSGKALKLAGAIAQREDVVSLSAFGLEGPARQPVQTSLELLRKGSEVNFIVIENLQTGSRLQSVDQYTELSSIFHHTRASDVDWGNSLQQNVESRLVIQKVPIYSASAKLVGQVYVGFTHAALAPKMLMHHLTFYIGVAVFFVLHIVAALWLRYFLRPSDEYEYMSKQLTKVQAFAELLRVQTHDYSNKLNTIGALIQMAQYDKAIELIGQESQGSQAQIENLLTYIQEPVIAGLLLGKYHKAREHNVSLEVSSDSALCAIHQKEMLERIVSILGNLIDNAIEAARTTALLRPAKVVVTVDETHQDIIFDVEDSGNGLMGKVEEAFTPQFSTKSGDQHGVGLYLVKTNLDSCHGTLEVGESELLGARITVFIPKQVKEQ